MTMLPVAERRVEDMDNVRAAMVGPFLADCHECMDLPLRFASYAERHTWGQEHWRRTRHRVQVWTDDTAMRRAACLASTAASS